MRDKLKEVKKENKKKNDELQKKQPPSQDQIIEPSVTTLVDEIEEQTKYDSDYHDLFEFETFESSPDHEIGEFTRRKRWIFFNPITDIKDVRFCKDVTFNIIE